MKFAVIFFIVAAVLATIRSVSAVIPAFIDVKKTPQSAKTYIVRHLEGTTLQLGSSIFRIPVTKNSSNGEIAFLSTADMVNAAVPPHFHAKAFETFFLVKGRVKLYANNEQRILLPGDFGAVPERTVHSYAFIEPDTYMIGVVFPGGFEDFFFNVSTPWNPAVNAPFPPDQPLAFPANQFFAVAALFDVNVQPTYPLNNELNLNGATNNASWHADNNTIPSNSSTPYYIANGWGPKSLGGNDHGDIVISLLAKLTEKGTVATLSMRRTSDAAIANGKSAAYPIGHVINVLEGSIKVAIEGLGEQFLGYGDTLYILKNTKFRLYTDVNWAKVYVAAANDNNLITALLSNATTWPYAVPPAYRV
ncbi:hypothetical protein HDU93_000741 [Gonapodya sp. JEL0774]|nr:hypothetical protein HDU93_000741 [Gonapodya sp. JEL0774]